MLNIERGPMIPNQFQILTSVSWTNLKMQLFGVESRISPDGKPFGGSRMFLQQGIAKRVAYIDDT